MTVSGWFFGRFGAICAVRVRHRGPLVCLALSNFKLWLNGKYTGKEESYGRFSYVAESSYMVDRRFYRWLCNRGLGLLQLFWMIPVHSSCEPSFFIGHGIMRLLVCHQNFSKGGDS
jgi:hypothetical protein